MKRKLSAAAVGILAVVGTLGLLVAKEPREADPASMRHNVYGKAGGGYYANLPDGGRRDVASSPCRMRPIGGKDCRRRNPATGVVYDQGDLTVLQPGEAVGAGCVEAPCAVVFGQ